MRHSKILFLKPDAIARQLDVDPKTVDRYLAMPGAPPPDKAGKYPVEAVTAFIGANAERDRLAVKVDGTLKALKQRELLAKCQRLELKLEIERGRFWPKAEVSAALTVLAKTRRAVMQRIFETELPPKLLGLSVIQIAEKLSEGVDQVCNEWSDRTKQWRAEKPAPDTTAPTTTPPPQNEHSHEEPGTN